MSDKKPIPLHSPTTKGTTPADGRRPIQTSKPKGGK